MGVFQGTIFVRYMTNRILLVAKYSPHFRRALVYTTRCRNADPIENLGDGTVFIVVAPEVRSRLYVTKESVHVVVLRAPLVLCTTLYYYVLLFNVCRM